MGLLGHMRTDRSKKRFEFETLLKDDIKSGHVPVSWVRGTAIKRKSANHGPESKATAEPAGHFGPQIPAPVQKSATGR